MNRRLIVLGSVIILAIILIILFITSVDTEKEKTPTTSIRQAEPISDSDWVKGKSGGKVTLIEYSDLQCPACAIYYPVVKQITEEFGQEVLFAYRHFPLRTIHFNSQLASQAAEAAGKQGKFWQMHDLLFENQSEWAKVSDPHQLFLQYAKELDLDPDQFNKDLVSDAVKEEVEKDYQSGVEVGVNVTPTFFLNNIKLQNPASFEEFRGIIQKEVEKNNE